MKLYLFIFIALLLSPSIRAQSITKLNQSSARGFQQNLPLTIGDKVTNVVIPKVIRSAKKSHNMADFKDKLLLLDFWFTNCPGCVASLPKMNILQKTFGSSIAILPVTFEPEGLVSAFIANNRLTKNLDLPYVVEDKVLSKIFKHLYDPHHVWIYKGRVIAITDPEYVNEKNIRSVLSGEKIDWPVKNDFVRAVDPKTHILQIKPELQKLTQASTLKYVAISGYIEGAKSIVNGVQYDSIGHSRRNYITNMSILDAYSLTWLSINPVLSKPEPNQIVLEVKSPEKYVYNPKWSYREEFKRKYSICYESNRPDSGESIAVQAKLIISDLDHLLGLKGRWEKRSIKALVLVTTGNIDQLKTAGGEEYISLDKTVQKLRNRPMNTLTWLINQQADNPRAFDRTGINEMIDMDLNINSWSDIEGIRKAIRPYGLDLQEQMMELDMFVITQQNP